MRRTVATTLGASAAAVLTVLLLLTPGLGCARPTAPPDDLSQASKTDVVLSASDRIQDLADADRPTLRLIHREGDPKGAVALAVFPEGGSRESTVLAALLETRLAKAGYSASTVSVHALGVVVAWEAESGAAGRHFLESARAALLTPGAPGEPGLERAAQLLSALGARQKTPSAVDSCLGLLGAEGSASALQPPTAKELERVRARSATAARVGLAALGSPAFLRAVAAAHQAAWPRGAPPDDSWTGPEEVNVTPGYPDLTLRVALRADDQAAALSAARALRRADHPLHARLAAVTDGLSPLSPRVTLRPRGACLALSWTRPTEGETPSLESLAAAALIAREEIHQSLRDARTEDESTLALLAPAGATEAVALAAWSAVRSPGEAGATTALIEVGAGPEWQNRQKEFRAAFAAAQRRSAERTVPMATRLEGGQAESWLLVGSPCGTAPELAEEAGLRALAVASLARALSGTSHVTLEPWISEAAIGLLGHASPLRGETPEHQAARIARTVAQAFSGPPLDGRDVAAARSNQLARVGSDPGRALTLRVLSSPSPAVLSPLGLEQELATLSASDVERARASLAREPLQAAFLASRSAGQAEVAQAALSEWLAPARAGLASCPVPEVKPGQPGRYTITTVDEGVRPSASVGVPVRAPRAIGEALTYLLNRPGGALDRALLKPGLVGSARAEWFGNERAGALLITLLADPEDLPQATEQTRALLDDLAKGGVSSADAIHAKTVWLAQQAQVARSPRGRVVELFLAAQTHPPPTVRLSRAELLELTRQLSADQHRITTVIVRK